MRYTTTPTTVVLVTGDRNWDNAAILYGALDALNPDVLIEGEARGADLLSRYWAENNGFNEWPAEDAIKLDHARKIIIPMPAQWNVYGRSAGPVRNEQQAVLLESFYSKGWDCNIYAFHNNLDESKGTKDMVWRVKDRGFKVTVFTEEGVVV